MCPAGKFQNASAATDCLQCTLGSYCPEGSIFPVSCVTGANMPHSATTVEGAKDEGACECAEGYFEATTSSKVDACQLCPSGSNCSAAGTTVATIPVKRGYYRRSTATLDVRRCPDAAMNCTGDAPVCAESTSGCRGTDTSARPTTTVGRQLKADAEEPWLGCAPGLTGIYCMTCDRSNASERVYYAAASRSDVASCKPCGETLAITIGLAFGGLAAICLLAQLAYLSYHRCLSKPQQDRLGRWWAVLGLGVKGKILFVFYQIVTTIDSVYQVLHTRPRPARVG